VLKSRSAHVPSLAASLMRRWLGVFGRAGSVLQWGTEGTSCPAPKRTSPGFSSGGGGGGSGTTVVTRWLSACGYVRPVKSL